MDPRASNSNYSSLGGENPVFKFDAPVVDDRLKDKGNQDKKKYDDPQEQWVDGLKVKGKDLNDNKTYTGKIIFIEKNKEGDIEYVTIQDEDEKKRKLDVDSLSIIRKGEKKIKGFNEWLEIEK